MTHAGPTEAARLVGAAARVLVVRADDLGDNVMASGFPGAVARAVAGECGFVGPPSAVDIIDTSGLDFVAGVDCRPRTRRDVLDAGRRLLGEIRRFGPDVVLLPRFGFEREAVGIALAGRRSPHTVTWVRDATPKRRRRDWWLGLVPGPRLAAAGVPLHEFARLQHFARCIGVDPDDIGPSLAVPELTVPELTDGAGPVVAVAFGAAQGRRWWPLERYAAVVDELSAAGCTVVLLGAPDEAARGADLRARMAGDTRVVDLVGRIPLPQTVAVIDRCALFLGNDSGLGHVAAAVGTPAVVISCHPVGAPADHVNAPERYRPVGGPAMVLRPVGPATPQCAAGCVPVDEPCCITRVPVDEVLAACRTLLADPGPVANHGR